MIFVENLPQAIAVSVKYGATAIGVIGVAWAIAWALVQMNRDNHK